MEKVMENAEEALELIASQFRVLGDAQRLKILHCLQNGEKPVGEIALLTGASPSNVSKHLSLLRNAGLVGRRQAGNRAYFGVTAPFIFELCDIVCDGARARLAKQQASLPEF